MDTRFIKIGNITIAISEILSISLKSDHLIVVYKHKPDPAYIYYADAEEAGKAYELILKHLLLP